MDFIKSVFTNNIDESTHKQFVRFGMGTFENRALIKIKKGKDSFNLSTSFEFVNDIIRLIADNIEKASINGKIIKNKKKTEVEEEVSSEKIKNLLNQNDWLLTDISSDKISFKTAKSLPKPGKALKDNFCKTTLPLSFLEEFAFDVKQDFKKLTVSHTFIIEEIKIPEEYKDNAALAREKATRKGKIVRILNIDGKEERKEIGFEA